MELTKEQYKRIAPVLPKQRGNVTLSKNLTCRFANREYKMRLNRPGYALRGARVTVRDGFDGSVTLLRKGRALPHRVIGDEEPPVTDGKTVSPLVDEAGRRQSRMPDWKPALDHPWRRYEPTAPAH